jgi:hypothetical protein
MEGQNRRILRLRDRKKLGFGAIGERLGVPLDTARQMYAAAKHDPGQFPDLSPRVRVLLREHPPFAHAETAREIFELLPQIRLAASGSARWPYGPKVKGFGPTHVQEIEEWLAGQGFDLHKAGSATAAPRSRDSAEAALSNENLATALDRIGDQTFNLEDRRLLHEAARRLRRR